MTNKEIRAIIFATSIFLLYSFAITSCNCRHNESRKKELRAGDTVYVEVAGEYELGIVKTNDTEHRMLIINRGNVLDNTVIQQEVVSYEEIR